MQVYDLQFTDRSTLLAGFQRAQERSAIDSCTLEVEQLRMRLIAPRDDAEDLAQRIYLDGGLRWCSGHLLEASGDDS
jgi:hypothetical protein